MIRAVLSRGVLYSIGIAINRVVPEKLFRFRVFQVFELQSNGDDPQADMESAYPLQYHWCESEEDFRVARQLTYFYSSSQLDRHRFSVCLACDGTDGSGSSLPIGGVWRAVEWFDEEELGLRVVFSADQAWIFAAYVSKLQRGRGIYRRLLSNVLKSNLRLQHFAAINPTNRKSIAAHSAFMRSTVGTCVAVRLLSLTICWAGGDLRLDRHVSFRSRTTPVQVRIEH
jgi:hypothetical protein